MSADTEAPCPGYSPRPDRPASPVSRLLIQRSVHDEVVDRVVELARTARMGDPLQPDTQVGPITTRDQYAKVLDYIDIAKSEGARLVLGHPGPSAATAGSSSPPSSPTWPTAHGWRRKRCSAPFWR
jgi:Aldehyde dehydrogenase family